MTQDLNTCLIDDIVNVGDIPEFKGVTVVRISDSGVTVSGNGLKDYVLSGRSPATLVKRGEVTYEQTTDPILPALKPSSDTPLVIPPEPFTIAQLVDLNGITMAYAYAFTNDKCIRQGRLARAPGQIGKSPSLYRMA